MDEKHPKRKKDALNPYTLTIESGIKFVQFKDSQGVLQKLELTDELYALFNGFELDDISYINVVSRHYELSELSEQSLHSRSLLPPESLEDSVLRKLEVRKLNEAIQKLPILQRRRLILYYFHGLTYKQIAESEGCTVMPVKRSIDKAIDMLRHMME